MSDSLQSHELQHARLLCPSPTPRACSSSCPWSQWCHPTISSSVVPSSSCLQSFPASGSFPMRQFFASDGQSIGASASAWVLPTNIQDWFPLGLTGLISLSSNGLLRVFSTPQFKSINSSVQRHQFPHLMLLQRSLYSPKSAVFDQLFTVSWPSLRSFLIYAHSAHSSALCCPHAEQHHK